MKPWWQSVRVVVLIIGLIGCQQNTAMIRAAEMRLRLGLQYQKVKQFRAATRNLLRATELSPDDYRPKLALALLYQQLSQAKLAEQWFHKARRVQPENSRIINNYGAFLCALGQYKKAQEQFDLIRHSNQIEGQDDAVLLAGLCTLDSGQKAQAISQLMHVSASSKPLRRRWLQHAEERVKQGRVIDAKLLLDVFRQRFGHEAQSLWLMILIAAQQGNMTQLDCYANQLALYFPHSQQYQRYKAHEY